MASIDEVSALCSERLTLHARQKSDRDTLKQYHQMELEALGKRQTSECTAMRQKQQAACEDVNYNKTHSPFLRKFPPEIRNRIFEETLRGHIIGLDSTAMTPLKRYYTQYPVTPLEEMYSLPQVSHQMFEETVKLVFSLPSFSIPMLDLRYVLGQLGEARANLIQVLIIDLQESRRASRTQMPEWRQYLRIVEGELDLDKVVSQLRCLQGSGQLRRIESVNSGPYERNSWCDHTRTEQIVEYVRIALEESANARKIIVDFTPGKVVPFE